MVDPLYLNAPDDDELDAIAKSQAERRRRNLLARHPDCRDPDHPGCVYCVDEELECDDYLKGI